MAYVGRNDPCPCGSGKKYKKCCLGQATSRKQSSEAVAFMEEVRNRITEREFADIEELNSFVSDLNRRHNVVPDEDFHGLSREQIHRFIHFPFASPDIVDFPDRLGVSPSAPVITLFSLMVDAIGEKGLKATAKGNLPRKFCQEAALAFWGEREYRERTRHFGINKEEDFPELNVTRFVAEDSGMLRKYQGKFVLSKKCRALLAEEGMARIYPILFRAHTERFNWGYLDRYPEIGITQRSFLFTLYLLTHYGDEERRNTFYEDAFLSAFPMSLEEVPPMPYFSPEKQIRKCYTLRTFVRFAGFFGLAEVIPVGRALLPDGYRVKATPLLKEVVSFHLPNAAKKRGKPDLH